MLSRLASFLLLTLLLFLGGVNVHAAPTATLKILPSPGGATVGTNFTVDFKLDTGGQSVAGILVSVSFSNNLEYVSSLGTTSVFDQEITAPLLQGNTFQFARVRFDTGWNGTDGQVLQATFRPIGGGPASITINTSATEIIAYSDSSNILASVTSGSFSIAGGVTVETGENPNDEGGPIGGTSSSASPPPTDPASLGRCALPIFAKDAPLPHAAGKLRMTLLSGQEVTFRDVPTNAWFARPVASLIQGGIASGYKDAAGNYTGLFGPADPVLTGQVAKLILQFAGENVHAVSGAPLNPTARGDWSELYVKWAEDRQISFFVSLPDVRQPTSRGAIVEATLQALGIPIAGSTVNPFHDLPSTHPYASALLTAHAMGVITGDTNAAGNPLGTVRPDASLNRAELAAIFVRFAERGCR